MLPVSAAALDGGGGSAAARLSPLAKPRSWLGRVWAAAGGGSCPGQRGAGPELRSWSGWELLHPTAQLCLCPSHANLLCIEEIIKVTYFSKKNSTLHKVRGVQCLM